MKRTLGPFVCLGVFALLASCNSSDSPSGGPGAAPGTGSQASCQLVPSGDAGPQGALPLQTQPVVTGLEVPWEVAALPGNTEWLITERPGRLRLMTLQGGQGTLLPDPVLTLDVVQSGEGGLLGMALDPQFAANSQFYLYYTQSSGGGLVNRVQRFTLAADHRSATAGAILLDDVKGGNVHNGGRLKFGPDGILYASTGEADDASAPRDPSRPGGKILQLGMDGTVTRFIQGLRNPQAFDWLNGSTMVVTDNGPTGEYQGRTGGDKLLLGTKGSDMGWPTIWHCESQPGLTSPILTWTDALPPGGVLVYRGQDIPEWSGNILIASTGGEQLHRVVQGADGSVAAHEVYLLGADSVGRERTLFTGPAGELYVTTTNCDGRGSCPAQKDGIYRITKR